MEEKKQDVGTNHETTPEDKQPTLEDLQKQIEALTAENATLKSDAEKVKQTISNANADASKWKSQYRSTLDEATRKEAERAEEIASMQAELVALKAEKRIADYTKKLMEAGYDAQTAAIMAAGLPDGITDAFFEQQKKFLETQKQQAKEQALNNQPGLSVGQPPATPSKEEQDIRRWMGLPTK